MKSSNKVGILVFAFKVSAHCPTGTCNLYCWISWLGMEYIMASMVWTSLWTSVNLCGTKGAIRIWLFSKSHRFQMLLRPFLSSCDALLLEKPCPIPRISRFYQRCGLRIWYQFRDGKIFTFSSMFFQASPIIFQMEDPCVGKFCLRNIHPILKLHLFFRLCLAPLNLYWFSMWRLVLPPSKALIVH